MHTLKQPNVHQNSGITTTTTPCVILGDKSPVFTLSGLDVSPESTGVSGGLPPDLKFVKTSELLPMAYDDFAKYLEEGFGRSPSDDDDCVVPSVSPRLSNERCSSSCFSWSSDESGHAEFFPAERNHDGSPSSSRCSPFGTLNWGLTPTIIYKTPSTVDAVGNGCMKCSITEGNIELVTPPPLRHPKRSVSRKRKLKTFQRRRKIYFGEEISDIGVQEVPNNTQDSETDDSSASRPSTLLTMLKDSSNDDPMWFGERDDWKTTGNGKNTSTIHTEKLKEHFKQLQELLPGEQAFETSQQDILLMAAQHIQALRKRIEHLTRCDHKIQKSESCTSTNFPETENVFELLQPFPWSDIDEPCPEIQSILNSLSPTACELPHVAAADDRPDEPKKKRKYTKRKSAAGERAEKLSKSKTAKRSPCRPITSTYTPENNSREQEFVPPLQLSLANTSNSQEKESTSPNQSYGIYILSNNTRATSCSPIPTDLVSFKPAGTPPLILPKPGAPFHSPNLRRLSPVSPFLSPTIPLSFSSLPIIYPRPAPGPNVAVPLTTPLVRLTPCLQTSAVRRVLSLCKDKNSEGWQQETIDGTQKKKTVPSGYMLYCKEQRPYLVRRNPDLSPGKITKLLSERWNLFSDEEKRPYQNEAMALRQDEWTFGGFF